MSRGRFLIAAIIAIISLVAYFGKSSENPVTGEVQRVGDITPDQEVALGLQAAPEMAQQFGGLSQHAEARQLVTDVCARLVALLGAGARAWPAGGSTRSTCPTSMALALDNLFQRTRSLTLAPCLRAIWVSVSPDWTR